MKTLSKKPYLLYILLLYTSTSFACINEYVARLNGRMLYGDADGYGVVWSWYPSYEDLKKDLDKARKRYDESNNILNYSDYGAMLLRVGQTEKARRIFIEIEKQDPGLYNTAANLGTAYELLGKNDSAYIWIKKALAINTGSHRGSEWIHLKILEAKLKAKDDNSYYLSHDILGLDFGNDVIPIYNGTLPGQDLYDHLNYQLRERMSLVKPKDILVGQLLYNYGNITAIEHDVKSAVVMYYKAKEYGYSNKLMDERIDRFIKMQMPAEFMNESKMWVRDNPGLTLSILFIGFVLGVIECLFLIVDVRLVVRTLSAKRK